jgi:DNA-binding FrmR family transcriptional regulator
MDELYNRLDRAVVQVNAVKSKIAKRDLIKMIRAVDNAMTAVDQELVECRRLHRETSKYRELLQQATKLIDNLEQHITFANLLG